MKIKLVEDARNAWRWTSMRGMALTIGIITGWDAMGDDLKAYLPHWAGTVVAVLVLVVVGMGGRIVKQNNLPDGKGNP